MNREDQEMKPINQRAPVHRNTTLSTTTTTATTTTTINTNPTNASPPYTSDSGGKNAFGSDNVTGTSEPRIKKARLQLETINQQCSAHLTTTHSTTTTTNPTPVSTCLSESRNNAGTSRSKPNIGPSAFRCKNPASLGKFVDRARSKSICYEYLHTGCCPSGDNCGYSHDLKEVQGRVYYRTRLCPDFFSIRGCRFGPACKYAHHVQHLRSATPTETQPWLPKDDSITTAGSTRDEEERVIQSALYSTSKRTRLPCFANNFPQPPHPPSNSD